MSEFRKDPIIGCWVIIATERGKRPTDFITTHEVKPPLFCPFCPGNETKTPGEVLAFREDQDSANHPNWWVRVVPNKYPALVGDGGVDRSGEGMYDRLNGIGVHEVIIETPDHFASMADYDSRQHQEIIWACRSRILELKKDERLRYIMIFKNHGKEAGASLDHPHTQLIALPIVPKRVKEEIAGGLEYYRFKERCIFCDMIRQEEEGKTRIVSQNDDFIAFCPYASRFPFETWILPREHSTHFADIMGPKIKNYGDLLKDVLSRMKNVLKNPPYNFMLHTSPCNSSPLHYPHYHWHLEITPKLTQVAGFEWGTGMYINPMSPESAAEFLRENVTKQE
jgi:UDPglucose--hexose-1-phosphate uridylyltransferase